MTAFVLKIIASGCMLLDHIGANFADAPMIFRSVGRIAFPIYAYMIAQGYKHTKGVNKFLMRLGVFALISEIPFDIAFKSPYIDGEVLPRINFLADTNVFYTLFIGVACIALYEKIKTKSNSQFMLLPLLVLPISFFIALRATDYQTIRIAIGMGLLVSYAAVILLCVKLPNALTNSKITKTKKVIAFTCAIPTVFIASLLGTDYGVWGAVYIFFFYLMRPEKRASHTIAMAVVVFLEYGYPIIFSLMYNKGVWLPMIPGKIMEPNITNFALYNFAFAALAVLLVWFYNGKQGKKVKWAFYAFYPVHIGVLVVLRFLL